MKYQVDTHTAHRRQHPRLHSTIHDYLPIARAKGIKLFATTDHGPDMADAPHSGISSSARAATGGGRGSAYCAASRPTSRTYDGEIDFPERYESRLDMIMAGFHEPGVSSLPIRQPIPRP